MGQSLDCASDQLELQNLPAPLDAMSHTLPMDDITERIKALEATPKLAPITLDDMCHAQAAAADDSLQPVLKLLKDQVKLPHSILMMLLAYWSQWYSYILQENVLYRRTHYLDGTTNFTNRLASEVQCSYIKQLYTNLGHFWRTNTCHAVSRQV